MCGMGWACHSVGVLADHSLEIRTTLGVVNCDAVTAVKNGQAVVAEIGAWFDNELHMWFLLSFLILYVTIINHFSKKARTFFGSEATNRAKCENKCKKNRLKLLELRKIREEIN